MESERSRIKQNLSFIAGAGVVGACLLPVASARYENWVEYGARESANAVNLVKFSQNVHVRAHEIRAQLLLGATHDPDNPEIAKLHGRPLASHLDWLKQASAEVTKVMEKLKDFTGDDARGLTLVERMDKTGARFLAEGVVPVQQKLAESQFTEAIALLLKQTNPRFEEFRETIAAVNGFAVDAANRLGQTAAESARME